LVKATLTANEEPFLRLSVAEQIALSDARVRGHVSYAIIIAFVLVNLATMFGLYAVYLDDLANLRLKLETAAERVVTAQVLIALLGATTVQRGSMAVIMAKCLFPVGR
jgi:hypothetical protein